jgi:RNA polymerase sigma-70 factor (ECF subfamily)
MTRGGNRQVADVDRERFIALYEEHFARVWSYAVSRVGRQLAEEVLSDTFALAWRKRARIPPAALPWLLAVARNVIRDSFRGASRRSGLTDVMRIEARAGSSAEPDVAEVVVERAAVLQALATLSDIDREVLTLVAWHDLSAQDAARVMGCSRATFAVRLHRARRRLERAVRQSGEDFPTGLEPFASSPAIPCHSKEIAR